MRQQQPTRPPKFPGWEPRLLRRPPSWKPSNEQLEQAAWFILEGLDSAVPRRYLLELMRVALVELERRLRKGPNNG